MKTPTPDPARLLRDGAWWQGVLIVLLALGWGWPALHGAFLWDDGAWTHDLRALTSDWHGLWAIWTDPRALQQYYPLTGTSFWIDRQLWGDWTAPYHAENMLLHAASALLFWKVLLRLELRGAWAAAAVFAVHPVMVESVAWIAERKNVLSMALMLASALCVLREGGWWRRAAGYALFVAALLAKITAFILPVALMLVAWWRRGRVSWRADVRPLLPHLLTALVLGLLVMWLEKHHVGADDTVIEASLSQRLLVAGHAPWFYLGKLFLPLELCAVYPEFRFAPGETWRWLVPVSTLLVPAALFVWRGRLGRGPFVCALFFLAALFPVLGLMNVYGHYFSPVADRWVYVPSLAVLAGFFALLPRRAGVIVALLVIPCLLTQSWRHAAAYQSREAFWDDVLQKNPASWLALNERGLLLKNEGKLDAARDLLRRAVEARPRYAVAWLNLGTVLLAQGQSREAMDSILKAEALSPALPGVQFNLGNLHLALGETEKAMQCFEKEVSSGSGLVDARNNLGCLLLQAGRAREALPHLRAVADATPEKAAGHANLALALRMDGQAGESIRSLESALKAEPDHPAALSNLAWLLATQPDEKLRDGPRAVELASRAGQDANALRTLAAALAEAGRYAEAEITAGKAIRLARAEGNSALAVVMEDEERLYRSGRPLRSP